MRHAVILNIISLVTFLLAVFFIATKGFHLSIEFTGGTSVAVHSSETADLNKIRDRLTEIGYKDFQVQNFGTSQDVMIRLPSLEGKDVAAQSEEIMNALHKDDAQMTLQSVEVVGSQVGSELFEQGIYAFIFVVVGIVLYLAIRFEWKFALAGVIANMHDVVIILGCFAFFEWEFSLSVLAGVLAVLGYSVNESVVVMDRIRENFRKQRRMSVVDVINLSITQTISRTMITHGSTQMMVLSMFFFGGPTLHNFSLALTIGIWFGIYSSVFVAAALAMWFGVKREDMIKKKKDRNAPIEEGDFFEKLG